MPTLVQLMDQSIAEVFRKAKARVADDFVEYYMYSKFQYICHALDDIGLDGTYYLHAKAARNIIIDRMSGHTSLATWLCENGHAVYEELTADNMQAYRHRWLDSLIEEFEKKGRGE